MAEGKASPSSGVHDRGKRNDHGHAYGAKSHPIKPEKVRDAEHRPASYVQGARAAHHGKTKLVSGSGNNVKIMAYVPDGAAVPVRSNTRHGHFAVDHFNDAVKKISHKGD
jgi:hypothetical protein